MKWTWLVLLLGGACAPAVGNSSPPAGSSAHVLGNALCPVSGSPVAGLPGAPSFAVPWRGESIGLMCPVCVSQFEAASAEQRDRWLARARASVPK